MEVEAEALCEGNRRGMGSNDHLALDVEVASWNFTFSSYYSTLPVALRATGRPKVWDQVTSTRLEIKVS